MDDFFESQWFIIWENLAQKDYLGKNNCIPLTYDFVIIKFLDID